jgi:hypothetical protein
MVHQFRALSRPLLPVALLAITRIAAATDVTVFSTDFEGPLVPAEFTALAPSDLTPVQDFAGLGAKGYRFAGKFYRHQTATLVTLTLTDLPPHTELDIEFLFAAIDSLDGTGLFPQGDYFRVTLDGTEIFRESFANALPYPQQIQSYVPAPGVELARRIDLGFNGPGSYFTDSAYDMSREPRFKNLPHTASTATFTFIIEGDGIQNIWDESWAFDNVRVIARSPSNPADLDGDGSVGAADLSILLAAWGATGSNSADLDGDGSVGAADLSILLVNWG